MISATSKASTPQNSSGSLYPADAKSGWGPQPKWLYHYTDWHGLNGIISSKTLWLTHALFLNDKSEMLHGFETVKSILEKLSKKSSAKKIEQLQLLSEDWSRDFGDVNVFVSSFCERGDTLEQWRGYTPVGGCSIGFSASELRKAAHQKNYWMLPCLYTAARKSDRIKKIFEWNLTQVRDKAQRLLERLSDSACSDFLVEIPRFKNYAF